MRRAQGPLSLHASRTCLYPGQGDPRMLRKNHIRRIYIAKIWAELRRSIEICKYRTKKSAVQCHEHHTMIRLEVTPRPRKSHDARLLRYFLAAPRGLRGSWACKNPIALHSGYQLMLQLCFHSIDWFLYSTASCPRERLLIFSISTSLFLYFSIPSSGWISPELFSFSWIIAYRLRRFIRLWVTKDMKQRGMVRRYGRVE